MGRFRDCFRQRRSAPGQMVMLYEGVSLNEDGRSHAFGVAESSDGVKWKKRPENPFSSQRTRMGNCHRTLRYEVAG